jgi:hypothetical protein
MEIRRLRGLKTTFLVDCVDLAYNDSKEAWKTCIIRSFVISTPLKILG